MWTELDRGSAARRSTRRLAPVFVAWLAVAALSAACSSSRGGVADAGDGAAADHPSGGDASGDRGNDRIADAHADADADADGGSDASGSDALVTDGATADASFDGGPATPVAVQVPFALAPTVAGWDASCVVSDSDSTGTSTCWVIQWRQWTYWALSNHDNRQAFLIVGADAAGTLKSPGFERMGARYLWLATVDSTAMTVSYFGQGGAVITISWADLDEEPLSAPEASEAAIELAPTVAGGWYASCVYGPGDLTMTNTCPVVKWGQWTYWALSNVDNNQALNIVAVDAHGVVNPAGGLIKMGTRYVWKVSVDSTGSTATFYGQANLTITATFDELRIDQH